ncbi:MAG: hypothetical protein PHQ52_03420 [Candidatus Omnitrophica bacterium]|nr:hypothetical protein [Candidatus Omnitrophota bacterium]
MKKYTRPKIKCVELDAEQAVLQVCNNVPRAAFFTVGGLCYAMTGTSTATGIMMCSVSVKGRSRLTNDFGSTAATSTDAAPS